MKKILLLVFAVLFVSASGYAQKQHLVNQPVMIGSNIALPTNVLQQTQSFPKYQLPYFTPANNNFNKVMFADNLQDEPFVFSTRKHPFPTDANTTDTARIIYNQSDPTNTDDYQYIGDTYMPINVLDAQGNSVFKLNGYVQAIPSLSYYYPQLYSGTFVIDSVVFWLYSFPNSPVKGGYLFSIANMNSFNLQNFGSTSFKSETFSFDYNVDIYNNLPSAYSLSPQYINSRIEQQGTGYQIQSSVIDFSDPSMEPISTWQNSDKMMIILTKESLSDLKDTIDLIGAWEWTTPSQQCFAGSILHYSNGQDTVQLLSATIAPMKPSTSSPSYAEWLQKYPYYMAEKVVRKNYRMLVYGRYTGEYNPNSVQEIDNSADAFELYQNAPNPVMNSTKIKFSIKDNNFVTLKVYNSLGEEVATIVNEFYGIGTYETDFDASNLPSGNYFYTLTSGNQSKTLPLVIVK